MDKDNLEKLLETYQREHKRLIALLLKIHNAILRQDYVSAEIILAEELFGKN